MCRFGVKNLLKKRDLTAPIYLSQVEVYRWRWMQLTEEEKKISIWFVRGYTPRWVAETLMLDRKTARCIFKGIYHKLAVADASELSRMYRQI